MLEQYEQELSLWTWSSSAFPFRCYRIYSQQQPPQERLLILGSGVAGCATALTAARHGIRCTVLHAGSSRDDCNSYWAQGGIIYRNYRLRDAVDTPLSLVNDIKIASGYLGPLQRTDELEEGWYVPSLIGWCIVHTVFFSTTSTHPISFFLGATTTEASHAAPRIIHHADCTGKVITTHITQAAANHPLIEFVGDSVVTDLIFDENSSSSISNDAALVIGAQVLNKQTNRLTNYYATHGVVLASGGLAGIYQHSTNPLGFNALGSSVGLAKGGIVSDLEYVQFHPTSLFLPNEARFLLTEALRGEGAILRDLEGRAFARDYHANGELAPRDIVARAVFCETQKNAGDVSGEHNAYLDITHRDSAWLKERFPSIDAHLMSRNSPMDFTKEWIPVIPAAHYTCGGVTTDLNGRVVGGGNSNSNGWYRNLYAAGEAARTGLHGGNRLASTSLLEGLVFGSSVGEIVAGQSRGGRVDDGGMYGDASSREATAILTHLKSLMWDNVGVVRTPAKLALAVSELAAIRDQADRLWEDCSCGGTAASWEVVALRDAAYAGLAVAESALANPVSGGAHYV
ncbi:l-aspartate oxidase, partial [Thalassiosira pseudonana CCMP1335]